MGDLIKAIFSAQVSQILLVSGVAFLFVAVAGNISGKIDPGKYGRIASGGIGGTLLLAGLILSIATPAPPPTPSAAAAPTSTIAVAPVVFTPEPAPRPTATTIIAVTLAANPRPTSTPGRAPAQPLQTLGSHGMQLVRARFSPDDKRIVTAGNDGLARIWDLSAPSTPLVIRAQPQGKKLHGVSISPDGKLLATAGEDNTAGLWDAATGAKLAEMPALGEVTAAEFNPTGDLLVTTGLDRVGRVWKLERSANGWAAHKLFELNGHAGYVTAAAFSGHGDEIATASFDGTARLWLAKDGSPVGQAFSAGSKLNSVAFSPDDRRLVTAGCNGAVQVWDIASGGQLLMFQHGPDLPVWTASFGRDGSKVLTASNDYSAQVWDAGSGASLLVMKHDNTVTSAAYSSDGRRVVTSGADGIAYIWDVEKLLATQVSVPLLHVATKEDVEACKGQ